VKIESNKIRLGNCPPECNKCFLKYEEMVCLTCANNYPQSVIYSWAGKECPNVFCKDNENCKACDFSTG